MSGTITRELYDKVFDKMVADAQPIPGFRRVKGGELLVILIKRLNFGLLLFNDVLEKCTRITNLIFSFLV